MRKTILWIAQVHEPPTKEDIHEEREEDGKTSYKDKEDEMLEFGTFSPEIVTPTPFGPYLIDDRYHPYKEYELWIGHANFDITEETAQKMEQCEGVEVLHIESRYRFIIGVGRLFTMTTVRKLIEDAVCANFIDAIDNEHIRQEVEQLLEDLSTNHKQWAIYILPNGDIDYITEEDEGFLDMLKQYEILPHLSNGVLLTSA